jgi:hypothetical protein
VLYLLELSPICPARPTTASEQIDIEIVESISAQIDQALYRLRLATPTPGLWVGSAAATLSSTLAAVEIELLALRQSLNW